MAPNFDPIQPIVDAALAVRRLVGLALTPHPVQPRDERFAHVRDANDTLKRQIARLQHVGLPPTSNFRDDGRRAWEFDFGRALDDLICAADQFMQVAEVTPFPTADDPTGPGSAADSLMHAEGRMMTRLINVQRLAGWIDYAPPAPPVPVDPLTPLNVPAEPADPPPDGPFGVDGFRFRGAEVRFGRAALRRRFLLALWDEDGRRQRPARGVEDVLREVYGHDHQTTEEAFRQLCSQTRGNLDRAAIGLQICNSQGQVWLEVRPT